MKKIPTIMLLCLAAGSQFCEAGIVLNGSNTNIVIESGATVVTDGMINGGVITNNGTIDNNGDWTNTGTAAVDNLVKFTGTSAQSISGTTDFQTVHVDNAAGVNLAVGTVNTIYEVLEMKNGTLTTGSGLLTFLSTSVTHCAFIDNFSPTFGGSVSGSVTAQRYHSDGVNTFDQHMMGSPINNGPFSNFTALVGTDGVAVTPTGDCDETQLDPSSNYGSLYQWDESLVSSCVFEGWVVRSSGSMTNARGYGVAIAGSGTVSVSGAPNLNTSYTQSGLGNSNWLYASLQGNNYSSGWHMLANPYLASLDLNQPANADFDNFVQIMNTHGGFSGTYQPLSMSSSALLPPFQGFMAHKTAVGGSSTFTFNASDRNTGTQAFHRLAALEGSMQILVEGNAFADITYFQFDPESTTAYDPLYDAYKFLSSAGQPTLYTTTGNDWLSINTNPSTASVPFVPMGFQPGADGTFTFTAQQINLPTGVTATLEDIQLGVFQDLSFNPTYTFASLTSDDAERFNVHFSIITDVQDIVAEEVRIWSNGSQLHVQPSNLAQQAEMNIYNAMGQLIGSYNLQPNIHTTVNLSQKATGVAIVRITTANNTFSQKVIINH